MTRRLRITLALLAIPTVLLAAGMGAALLIPTDRVARLAAEKAGDALGREVALERVSLSLFPAPAVALSGVKLAGPTAGATPVATVDRVLLRPRLLPLLKRQVLVDQILLERPRLLVTVDSAGVSNLPTFGAGDSAQAPAREAGGDVAFLVRRFEIRNGRIAYRDDQTGTAIRLDGYEQRLALAGELGGGELRRIALEGRLSIDALGAVLPGKLAVPIEDVRIALEHKGTLDLAGDSLTLEHLALQLQELALEGVGTVHGVTKADARSLAVRLSAGPVDVGQLIRSLPKELLAMTGPDGKSTELPKVDGILRLDVVANGALGEGKIPAVEGKANLERFALGYPGMGELVTELGGDVAFSLDSVSTTNLSGRLLGEPLKLAFAVHDPAAPRARATVQTALDLARATKQKLIPDSLGASGKVGLDLKVAAPLLEPAKGAVDGTVKLQGVRVKTPALGEPMVLEQGTLAFEGARLRADALAFRMGESDLTLALDVRNWLPFALGDSVALPRISFDARSKKLDLDALLPAPDTVEYSTLFFARMADRPVKGRPAEVVAKEAGFALPTLPPMELDGKLRATTLRKNALDLQNVEVALRGNGERLELTDARFQIMGGGVQVAAQIGMPLARAGEGKAVAYPAAFSFQVRDVGAAPFFNTFTPFREHLTGSLLLSGTARAVLDETLLPVRESVAAEGLVALGEGELVNWPALKKLGEQFGLARFDTLAFKDWMGKFSISGPRIALHETAIESGEMRVRAAGTLDFAGVLDFGATLDLSPAFTSKVRGTLAPRLTGAAAGPDGHIPVGLKLSGPALKPELSLDLSAAANNALAEAKREAESKARAAAEDAAQKAASKLLPGADSLSLPAAADSARAKVDAEVKKKVCKLIKC